ncbi:MAG: apolipoprotein N-acyltransferase [Rhizobiaceae bacterium]|nr:MAG: apolipoprotein N-acyltransferase [Rhizobiaceae bacterium]
MSRLAGKFMLLWGWRRALVAFLAGALAVLSQAPFDFFAAAFVSFPLLVWLLDGATAEPGATLVGRLKPAFAVGWWFGFGYFVAGLWWIGNAVVAESESNAWAVPLAVIALPALLAIFYGLAAAVARMFWSDGAGRIAALAFGFGLFEWLRSWIFTGFPWNAIGYAAMPVPLMMQSVSLVGLFGMNVLAVFVFAMPAVLADRRPARIGIALAVLLVVADLGYGSFCLSRADASGARLLDVRLVQPAIDQSEKWDHAIRDRIFDSLIDLTSAPPHSGAKKPSLIVWPETAVPFLFTQRPDALARIGKVLDPGQTLLTGAVRVEGNPLDRPRYYNSVLAINDDGEITDAVDKLHLVPFGEYLPFENLLNSLGIQKLVDMPGPFVAGTERHPIRLADGLKALPFICYEVIFPGAGEKEAARSDLIVNVTNDAWFGDTPGPYQHLRQAELRAVELGLPMVRAANNGISAAIDAHGRILDAFALDARGGLDVSLPLAKGGNIGPQMPERIGLLLMAVFGLYSVGMNLLTARRAN